MKICNYRSRNVMIALILCVLSPTTYAASRAMTFDAPSGRVATEQSVFARSVKDSARIIVRRIPTLGNNVIVDLYIDGVAVAAVGYGHTYEGSLPLGRHVLSVKASPSPKWPGQSWQTTLDVRTGETYTFTALDDGSGDLILKGG